ncbi:MAG: dihydroxyacetone kinase phosphoryl donor subunit DhaM [Psychromonas sp.]
MISIVIVSHSPSLAQGIYELATQMTQGKVKIGVAAGVDDPENPIGTDATAIMSTIEEVYCSDGVLVMVDMGSAILSAEMAVELIDIEKSNNIYICAAPIMEGTMSACVAAAAGMLIDEVMQEAHSALEAKYQSLNQLEFLPVRTVETQDNDPSVSLIPESEGVLEFEWIVRNLHGLHARPTAAIVATIANFDATANLHKGNNVANAKSLNSIAVLGVSQGDTITLRSQGVEAEDLINAFSTLAQAGFGESIDVTQVKTDIAKSISGSQLEQAGSILGVTVCEGIASGKVVIFEQVTPTPTSREFTSQEIETQRLHEAIERVSEKIEQLRSAPQSGEEHANIFEAHIMMLTDPELLDEITSRIAQQKNVEQASYEAISELAQSFRETSSEYMQAREADVWDIGRQLMHELCGRQSESELQLAEPAIIFSEELSPSNTAKLDPNKVLAICLSRGNPSSHSAILAKSMGIPTIFKLAGCLQKVELGQFVCVNGFEGRLWYSPDPKLASRYEQYRSTTSFA